MPRPLMAVLAGLAFVAAGCGGGSAATPTPRSSPSALIEPTAAPTPVPTPTPADPDAIFDQAIAHGPAWQPFHARITLDGSIKATFLKGTGDRTFASLKSDLTIDGLVIEGDLDTSGLGLHLGISVPAIPALHRGPVTGNLIIKNSLSYLQLSSLGKTYFQQKLAAMSHDLGLTMPIPTPGPSALVGVTDQVASFRKQLEAAGVRPTLVGIEQIGGRDAYHIDLSVPLDWLNGTMDSLLKQAGAKNAKQVKFDSATSAMWIYKDSYELAQVQITGVSSSFGDLRFSMTLTDFGQPVTVNLPPAADVVVVK